MHTQTPEQLQALFELAHDMLCVARLDGNVTPLNAAWERVTGHPPAALSEAAFAEYIHPEDREHFHSAFGRLTDGERVTGHPARFRCSDQTYRWLHWHATAIDGVVYALARDVTASHEADQRVARGEAALRRNAAIVEASIAQAEALVRELHALRHVLALALEATDERLGEERIWRSQ